MILVMLIKENSTSSEITQIQVCQSIVVYKFAPAVSQSCSYKIALSMLCFRDMEGAHKVLSTMRFVLSLIMQTALLLNFY